MPTRVVVTSGRVIVLAAVGVQVKVPVGPPDWKTNWFLVVERFKAGVVSPAKVGEEVVDTS